MKRLYLGLGILAALLVLCWGVFFAMDRIHTPMGESLLQAAQAAEAGDWDKAKALASTAKARWDKYYHFVAVFADHTPMDELEGLFGELQVYLQQQELPHFSAVSRHLSQLAQAMADNHRPAWWNFF